MRGSNGRTPPSRRLQERPPPLPPPRAYTVSGGVKLGYPQTRIVTAEWSEPGGMRLLPGTTVVVVGAGRRGHVAVQAGSRTVHVPHRVLAPPRARAHAPPPPTLPTHAALAAQPPPATQLVA